MKKVYVLILVICVSLVISCKRDGILASDIKNESENTALVNESSSPVSNKYPVLSDENTKSKLTELQHDIAQKNKSELPFENEYWDNKAEGIYVDAISGEPLFLSKDKYDSGTGWPSFTKPIDKKMVINILSNKDGVNKTDVKNSTTNSHLGNLYYDGPKDSGGTRYCMYSASLRFVPKADMEADGYGYLLNQVSK